MKHPSPIPIPFSQRWHDFKTAYLPILTFLLLCGTIFWMWGRYVTPSNIVGEVEAVRAHVISLCPGTLQELKAERFQHVTNGQCLAVIKLMELDGSTNQPDAHCISLYSPMDGFVSDINYVCGENVMAGSHILVVSAECADRVLAWVRQPITQTPKVGDHVKIHRPRLGQPAISGKVIQVGHQFEQVHPSLLPANSSQAKQELGLPFLVQLSPDAHMTPGEPVQLKFSGSSRTWNW